MPRGFRTEERERIRERLIEVGQEHFERFGARRTNVEDLTRGAGIAKGSFYQFFDSKETLYLTVVERVEGAIREQMVRELADLRATPARMVRRLLEYAFTVVREHPIVAQLADPEEMAFLLRKVPAERLKGNREDDDRFFGGLIREWQREGILVPVDTSALVGFLRACVMFGLQREMIGPEVYESAVALLLEGMTAHLSVEQP